MSALLDPELSAGMTAMSGALSNEIAGWFCVGLSADVAPGTAKPLRFFGRDYVLLRTESGAISMLDALCPHLGADLEPTPVLERVGLLMTWRHPRGGPPEWALPDWDESGFSAVRGVHTRVSTHPQDTSENSVDLGHFSTAHGYKDVHIHKPIEVADQRLSITYRMVRSVPNTRLSMPVQFAVDMWGLGLSIVTFGVIDMPFEARLFILASPSDVGKVELRAVTQVRVRGGLLLNAVAPWVRDVANRFVLHSVSHDVEQDRSMWEHRQVMPRPRVVQGDGPIGRYRSYVRQFYPTVLGSHGQG